MKPKWTISYDNFTMFDQLIFQTYEYFAIGIKERIRFSASQ
jgi:hypothetical protein